MIRKYRDDDSEAIKSLTIQTFHQVSIARAIEEVVGKCGETTWVDRKKGEIQADIDANPDGIFVAEEQGRIIGFITTRVDSRTRIGWIPNMAVAQDQQGKGLGKQLLQTALSYLRSQGMTCCKIETLENNEVGKKFYPSIGFKEVARQIHYIMQL